MECATIQKQRRELQLLIAELKDRDRELNTMAASHHKQLQAWEQDRQRVLTLEQRCARLQDELQKRTEVIRVLTKRVKTVETREREIQRELGMTQQQLQKLGHKQQDISQKYEDLEQRNQSLSTTVMALSSQVGSLQVREEELSAMLKLKDKDVREATVHIVDLTKRLRDVEMALKERQTQDSRLQKDLEEKTRCHREAGDENTRLKEELQQHVTQSSAQREEIIRLKQEAQLLRREMALSGEGDSWKDELLLLARSKQERTESELNCLRQVCENQQNDLQLLQLNLDSTREALRERNTRRSSHGSQGDSTCGYLDQSFPSPRMKTTGPANDKGSLSTVNQQDAVSGDLGVFSAASNDGDYSFSTYCLQRMLDESREMVASLDLNTRGCLSSSKDNVIAVGLNDDHEGRKSEPSHLYMSNSSPTPGPYTRSANLHPKPDPCAAHSQRSTETTQGSHF